MGANLKTEISDRRIQEVELNDEGIIVESDNAIFELAEGSSISDLHPFFEGVLPLLSSLKDSLKIPCVNVDTVPNPRIVDVDFLRKDKKLYLLLFDFTEHYEASQPLVQEKNVASIAKNRLAFEKQLLEAKEEFKNNFLSNLNHEIRNPLNNLLGFMELLKETRLDYDQNETLKVMQKTGTHLKILMDDMLDISKIERGVLDIKDVNFNLGHLVNNLHNHFKLKYIDNLVEFNVSIDSNVPRKLIGDPARLNQILFNLLENAFRNTEDGHIALYVKAVNKTKTTTGIQIIISDSGVGIPDDKLDKVFDTYFQLQVDKLKPLGEGLGLKIVKDLTESLKGSVQVSSEEGKGTVFTCMFPFKVRASSREKKTIPKGTGILMSKRILIVEDETTNQMLMMKTFLNNEKGYVIEMAINSEHAFELLKNNRYNLIMFKSVLPDIDAIGLIKKIRNHEIDGIANLPILIASGNTLKEEQDAVLKAGASAFLPKPYSKNELFKSIEQLIR
ncbi:MAG: hybrid sensor histidine kinase/response regulator [Bacteroidia bacterium]|nr:hybrid sensor histidine kinase/response regulator [Bacteroidia bacterium]NNF30689.1 response regulator [Flavobacteriaceae bacterium]NNM07953.1 response regulator [Flavobacteriaceae bacterium]